MRQHENKRTPTNANAQKLKKALKEQQKYIQYQINKIRNSEKDKQS